MLVAVMQTGDMRMGVKEYAVLMRMLMPQLSVPGHNTFEVAPLKRRSALPDQPSTPRQ